MDHISKHKHKRKRKQKQRFDWRKYVLEFGKYEGKTMYELYINDFAYIRYLDRVLSDRPRNYELRQALTDAIDYQAIHGDF